MNNEPDSQFLKILNLHLLTVLNCILNYFSVEHEACAMDINELNWHVSYRSRIMERIEKKVKTAEALNIKVNEDIAFVQQHW